MCSESVIDSVCDLGKITFVHEVSLVTKNRDKYLHIFVRHLETNSFDDNTKVVLTVL